MAGLQSAWGLDVGITSLKAIKLRKEGDKLSAEAFDVIEHDKFLSEPDVDRDELIRVSLRKFLDRNPIKNDAVFVGVPGSSTFARFVKLPPVDPKKIPEIVRFEAIQQIPFPLDQVNWDYQTFVSPDSPEVEVGIFAMKKDLVAQVLSNFRLVGLTVTGVQMSPLAVYNAAAYDGLTDGKGTVLIDMGAEHTDLVIMDQGRLWLRTINIGGNHFTDALAKSFKQPFSRAETLKKTAATSKYQKQIFQAMRPIFADLVAEIQRSIGHYNSSHRDSKLERIVGMGNPLKLPNLQKYLQQELKMEVLRLDNFRKVVTEGKLAAALNEHTLSMTSAYGLAVQGLGLASIDTNLLPIEIARQMMWRSKRPWFIATAALMVVVAGWWAVQPLSASSELRNAEQARNTNNAAISDATKQMGKWTSLGNTYDNDKRKVDSFLKLADDRALWPSISLDIWRALPQAQQSKAAGTASSTAAGSGTAIVITSIDSQYTNRLASTDVTVTAPTPAGGAGGAGAFPGGFGGPFGGRFVGRSPMGGFPGASGGFPSAGSGSPAPESDFANPSAATVGSTEAAKPGDRGFTVGITGYVSGAPAGVHGDAIVHEYEMALLARAAKDAKDNNKPYYFDKGAPMSGDEVRDGVANGLAAGNVWGNVKGPFYEVFAPELMGIKLEDRGNDVATMPPIGPVDMFRAGAPGSAGPPMMKGQFSFVLKIKVYLKEPPAGQ